MAFTAYPHFFEDMVKLLDFLKGHYDEGGPKVTGTLEYEGHELKLRFDELTESPVVKL